MWVVINCVLVKQSSEIPISKIHEATRYSASLKLTLCVEIVAEKFRVRCFRANLVVEKRVWFCSAEQIYNSKLLLFDGLQLTTRSFDSLGVFLFAVCTTIGWMSLIFKWIIAPVTENRGLMLIRQFFLHSIFVDYSSKRVWFG
ncbi:unnamed protein product [Sphagnum troendelagicum]